LFFEKKGGQKTTYSQEAEKNSEAALEKKAIKNGRLVFSIRRTYKRECLHTTGKEIWEASEGGEGIRSRRSSRRSRVTLTGESPKNRKSPDL